MLVFEDLHWIDSETQAVLDGLIGKPADRTYAIARKLPSRVPAWLGEQDLLLANSHRPANARRARWRFSALC